MVGVLVLTDDHGLLAFSSLREAEGEMEAVGVDLGEYPAAFLLDGTVVRVSARDERVVLVPTGTRDAERLHLLVEEHRRRTGAEPGGSVLDLANDLIRAQSDAQWPKRPRWLAARLKGAQPVPLGDDSS